jgi:DNA repair photolyase
MMEVVYEPRGAAREYAERACNLYKGCVHGCTYCYAPSAVHKTREEWHGGTQTRNGVLENLRADLMRDLMEHGEDAPRILFCFTSDPYQPGHSGATRQALQLCRDHYRKFAVLTKGGQLAERDFDLYEDRGHFGTTLAWTNDADRAQWEPGGASVESRVEAIKTAHRRGIRTWVSIEPVIDPVQALSVVDLLDGYVDEWRVGKWNHDARANAIDWRMFTAEMHAKLVASGASYLVKDALAPYLPTGAPRWSGMGLDHKEV